MRDINHPDVYYQHWEEYDKDGISVASGSDRFVRVRSSVLELDELKDFLDYHWEYESQYDFFMSYETFEMYCKKYDIQINCKLPHYFQCQGLNIFIISIYLKPGEILAVPQHEYEHQELSIIG